MKIPGLKRQDVGRWVLYNDGHGKLEKGRIKSWNDKFIFVVYKCDNQWDRFTEYTGCATDPNDLVFTTMDEVKDKG